MVEYGNYAIGQTIVTYEWDPYVLNNESRREKGISTTVDIYH